MDNYLHQQVTHLHFNQEPLNITPQLRSRTQIRNFRHLGGRPVAHSLLKVKPYKHLSRKKSCLVHEFLFLLHVFLIQKTKKFTEKSQLLLQSPSYSFSMLQSSIYDISKTYFLPYKKGRIIYKLFSSFLFSLFNISQRSLYIPIQ